ncbi:hypothetical protein HK104_007016, partial [Borealophlyctis nickersoniae]
EKDEISDIPHLTARLPRGTVIEVVEEYEHLDFLWAPSAKQLAWDHMIKILKPSQKKTKRASMVSFI